MLISIMEAKAQVNETQIAPIAQTNAVLPTPVLNTLFESYHEASVVEKEKEASQGLLALYNTGTVPGNTTKNIIQDQSKFVHDPSKPPKRKRTCNDAKRTHVCVDEKLKMFDVADCSSCRPNKFCLKHPTREGYPRVNDCSVCHPGKKRKIIFCGHCNVKCKNPDCNGCARKYNCLQCAPHKIRKRQESMAGV